MRYDLFVDIKLQWLLGMKAFSVNVTGELILLAVYYHKNPNDSDTQQFRSSLIYPRLIGPNTYRKNPKISDTREFAVVTLEGEQDGFSLG